MVKSLLCRQYTAIEFKLLHSTDTFCHTYLGNIINKVGNIIDIYKTYTSRPVRVGCFMHKYLPNR